MRLELADTLGELLIRTPSIDGLNDAMGQAAHDMGFQRFALSLEIGSGSECGKSILLHDYPASWADVYLGFNLAATDPIRRAAERSLTGFRWKQVRDLIPVTAQEEVMFTTGYRYGIADGFTVPRHLPGEAIGSCSFVVGPGQSLPEQMLIVADTLGAVALERARLLSGCGSHSVKPKLTERQRDCVLWVARGKTDWEISRILGISRETVTQHINDARERYDSVRRGPLILHALFDGLISFTDIFRWRPHR
ncbi:DNA-binding CsgD family transcriptional regulator [Sphingobium sp. B11D3B]|uniref:LuxR family transcriptional regulator n=1 Tax=Sphingobium sp. B11D3B TaxID=2940575 RepID=UPI002227DC34|nr:autoinducer binding domain-containing protein [Sphingobium sp. B11D3B]MCW2387208.1 DNA-binding CsgD family transcriptional regulator [Sphingobium sp. B11D3B]